MKPSVPPQHLPIWRDHYRAAAPDGTRTASIDPALEISMGNPTAGVLCVSDGLHLTRCSPSFVWSDDSRYLAVPQFFDRFIRGTGSRLLLIDFQQRVVWASRKSVWNYQPETFAGGRLVVSVNPARSGRRVEFQIPADIPTAFARTLAFWPHAPCRHAG